MKPEKKSTPVFKNRKKVSKMKTVIMYLEEILEEYYAEFRNGRV